ncbi:AMP-binding protein [Ralstonia solanacearum]|uniref:AMP-binding protein n=1 Tax=Ralstonia solanacearum TaxID=305 RepID=UPI000A10C0C2|nr:AMP-binding protein [Ralstonia solanacearum]
MSQHDNPPLEPDNLVALLEWLAASRPGDTAYVFLQDADESALRMTYAELRDAAKRIAVHLLGSGCRQDQPVLLIFYSGLDYICPFFGCLLCGRPFRVPADSPPLHAPPALKPISWLGAG